MELRPQAPSRVAYLASVLAPLGTLDPQATATTVLNRFGSIAAFANADIGSLNAALPSVPGLPMALIAAQQIAAAGRRETALTSRLDPNDPRFLDYLRLRMADRKTEILLGFFATQNANMLSERTLASSEGHQITISAAAILREAIVVAATSLLLVHNHPSGVARPGRADELAMDELTKRAAAVDIRIIDHLIVGGQAIFSMQQGREL